MKKSIVKALSLVLSTTLVLSLSACAGGKTANGGSPAPSSASAPSNASDTSNASDATSGARDTLRIALRDDPQSMSPFEVCNGLSQYTYDILYEKLFVLTPEGEVEPWLVEAYEQVSPTEYEFKLKEGVLFHDGSEMTAEDVKASLDNAGTYPVPEVHEKEVSVTGKYTFTITTPRPDVFLLEDDLAIKWNSIVPKKLLEAGNDFKVNPIGSGPYRFKERATSEYVRFESFDGYRSAPVTDGRFQTIVFKIIPEPSSRTIALENGEVDMVCDPELMDLQRMIDAPNIEVNEAQGQGLYNLTLNKTKAGLDDINVRKAIACAIDPQPVMDVAINGYGTINRTMILPGYFGYTDVNTAAYDPAKAKEYLAKSGYKPGELTFKAVPVDGGQALTVIQGQLAEIGIHLSIENQEDAVWIDESAAGKHEILLIANSGVTSTYSNMNLMFHSSRIRGANRTLTNEPELDHWLQEIPYTWDEKESEELYHKCAEYIQDDCAFIPLFVTKTYIPHAADLTNFKYGPNGERYLYEIRVK